MRHNARTAALVAFALPACAMAQTAHEVSRIGGSIYPTVIQPTPLPVAVPAVRAHPATAQGITAVCITSQAHADRCNASANMAVCDVDRVGLSHCLSHYAHALVKQPIAATRSVSFMLRDAQGGLSTVTVLATAAQSDEAIARAASAGASGTTIAALRMMPHGDGFYVDASRAPWPLPQLTGYPPDAPAAGQTAAPSSP